MPSFFEKLRNSMGIEEEELEEEEPKQKKPDEKTQGKKNEDKEEGKEKKVQVKSSKKEDAIALEEHAPDWFEPEGELAVDV